MARILAIDDEPGLRMVYDLLLTKLGHSVRCARNVAEAKELILTEMPEVVILDYLIPDANGDSLLDWLAEHLLSVPVVVISGQVGTPHLQAFPDSRIAGYLGKPFRIYELAALIDEALKKPRQSRTYDRHSQRRQDPED